MELNDDFWPPNAYGQSTGRKTKLEIALAFESAGWRQRMCAWDEWEIANDYSELPIEGDEFDNLINGWIMDPDEKTPLIGGILTNLGMEWSFEIYDANKELVSYHSNSSAGRLSQKPSTPGDG